jgi:hypothetical protein
MRSTLTVCRTGLCAAALVVLTACSGGDGNDSSASAKSTTASSASETTAGASSSEFCTQAAAVQERVGATFSDPTTLPAVLQEAATQIRAIDPPEELASDWKSFADGIEQIASAAKIDFNDQAAVATFRQKAGALQQQYGAAFTNVETYLRDECGITGTSTETSAPPS